LSAVAQRAKAEATKQFILSLRGEMDCFAGPVIGRAFARGAVNRELRRPVRKRNLASRVRQNNATGKSVKTCPVPRIKIFLLPRRANQWCFSARLTRQEGRCATSRTWVEMRWTQMLRLTSAADADGEGAWF